MTTEWREAIDPTRSRNQKKISNGLKNPTEKILSAGFFYPLGKFLLFLQRINFEETTADFQTS